MKLRKFLFLLLIFIIGFSTVSCSCGKKKGDDTPDDPVDTNDYTDYTNMTYRYAKGTTGAVTCSNNLVSKIGLDVLQSGGNAYDAAVAMSFALGVLEPNASGIGGGGIMTAYDAKNQKYVFYNFREFAPGNIESATISKELDLKFGGLAVAVPMQVAGLLSIYDDLGSGNKTLAELMQPSINYAKNGYEVTDRLYENMIYDIMLMRAPEEALNIYGTGVRPYRVGETITNTGLATVYEAIAQDGLDGFYSGDVAEAIIAAVAEQGGVITQDDLDLAKTSVVKSEPLHSSYNGYDIYTAQLPGAGGIVISETLNMLEAYTAKTGKSIASLGYGSTEYIHAYATASQLAYADKRYYVADNGIDPTTSKSFINVPVEGLTSKAYAAARFNVYNENLSFCKDLNSDFGGANGADPWDYETVVTEKQTYEYPEEQHDYGTTSFSVMDKDGNVVTITQTINTYWGSYVMPAGYGFFLNNQMADFTFDSKSVNKVEAYKRPISSMAPTILEKDGKIVMTVGCPGSGTIPNALCQVILNVVEFGMGIQEAIDAKRVQCIATESADMDYYYKTTYDNTTYKFMMMEGSIADWGQNIIDAIKAKQYHLEMDSAVTHVYGMTISYNADGTVKQIVAGADTRKDGKALAY